jgi:hypothetical protein
VVILLSDRWSLRVFLLAVYAQSSCGQPSLLLLLLLLISG